VIYWLTSAVAFLASVAVSIMTARWLMRRYKSWFIALAGTAAIGVVLSAVADFMFAYSVDEYDRSFQGATDRGLISAAISAFVGYLALWWDSPCPRCQTSMVEVARIATLVTHECPKCEHKHVTSLS
jgi:hypothetical protein